MALRRGVVAAAAVMVLAAVFTAPPALAATAFTVSGTWAFHPPPSPEDLLPGYFAADTVVQIDYPAATFGMDRSVAVAVAGLTKAVDATVRQVVLSGFSQGAIAVTYEKKLLMSRPAAQRPAVDMLTFVTVGDPTGPGGIMRFLPFTVPFLGLSPVVAPETPYDTVIVNGEYDAWGDFPDRPWNLISLANAVLGIAYVHGRYEAIPGGLDLEEVPARNITVTTNSLGGTTTSYLIPTLKLPLVQPLRDIGIPESIVAALEGPLKQIVDAGYVRNDTKLVAAQPSASARDTARRPLAARSGPGQPRTDATPAAAKRRPAAGRAAAA